jgi:hypothetical protein
MLERHLDPDLYAELKGDKYAGGYWLAMQAGRYSSWDVIDLDSHHVSRWRTEYSRLPFDEWGDKKIYRPVMSVPVVFWQRLKKLHQRYPQRVFCISSETLGIHAWQFHQVLPVAVIQQQRKSELAQIGLNLEVYPMKGRVFRRPFGTDYRTITNHGVLQQWRDQLHFFVNPEPITWPNLFRLLFGEWARQHPYQDEMELVQEWAKAGFPLEVQQAEAIVSKPSAVRQASDKATQSSSLTIWSQKTIKQWEALAKDGLQEPDTCYEALWVLARYLFWVELWHLPEDQRKAVIREALQQWAMNKHNGCISHLKKVPSRIKAAINAVARLPESYRAAEIRRKQANGEYKRLIRLLPLMNGSVDESVVYTSSHLRGTHSSTDSQALPEPMITLIKTKAGRKPKALLRFATNLLACLYTRGGVSNISRETLFQMARSRNHATLAKYKRALGMAYGVGLLLQSPCIPHHKTARYGLSKKALAMFAEMAHNKK